MKTPLYFSNRAVAKCEMEDVKVRGEGSSSAFTAQIQESMVISGSWEDGKVVQCQGKMKRGDE